MTALHGRLHRFHLVLDPPLATAHGCVRERAGLIVELRDEEGRSGFGEAAPLRGFHTESLSQCAADLTHCLRSSRVAKLPSSAFAIECAQLDLEAQRLGLSLAEWLAKEAGGPARSRVPVNALVDGEDAVAVALCARSAVAEGFQTFKLKVGIHSLPRDLDRIASLRDAVGEASRIRLDANGAWSESEALTALKAMSVFEPEWVEQPVAAERLDAMARLRASTPVPIAADEAVQGEAASMRLLEIGAADVLVLKPPVCGGLRSALRISRLAQAAGVRCAVTTLLDSAVGRAAALHLAAALPGRLPACGLATGSRIAMDLAELPPLEAGEQRLPGGTGLGVRLDPAALHDTGSWHLMEPQACS